MAFNHFTATAAAVLTKVLSWEADHHRSRETVTILAGSGAVRELKLGTVLGKATLGTPLAETLVANTGNGTLTVDAVTPLLGGARKGAYTVECIAAAANGGTFVVFSPDGYSLGMVEVGATFANHIRFAIADGGTDFVVGDGFVITVPAGTGKIVALAPAAVDGTQYAYGVMSMDALAPDGIDGTGQAIVKDATVNDAGLIWPTGITAAQKAVAVENLLSRRIDIATAV